MDLRNVLLLVVLGIVVLLLFSARPMAAPYQRAAIRTHILVVLICGLLALFSITAGIVGIIRGSPCDTEFSLLGAELSTSDVGVALVGIGLLITYFTTRSILKTAIDPAAFLLGKFWKSRKRNNRRAHEPFR
jgi:hypothetical protein